MIEREQQKVETLFKDVSRLLNDDLISTFEAFKMIRKAEKEYTSLYFKELRKELQSYV